MTDSELDYIFAALQWKFGWLIGLASWQTLIRTTLVFFNNKAREFMEQAVPEDAAWAQRLFNHRAYRLVAFLLNAAVSVKLPLAGRKPAITPPTAT